MKIHNFEPSDSSIDKLGELLDGLKGSAVVYFPLWVEDPPQADYGADIDRQSELYGYEFGGHGIGERGRMEFSLDDLISQVLEDNARFNSGGEFQLKVGSD